MIHRLYRATLTACLFAVTGCGTSPPVNLYLLEATEQVDQTAAGSLVVLVDSVTVPDYLKRKEIIRRDRVHSLQAASYDRWAEPINQNITAVLTENLARTIPSSRVFSYPWVIEVPHFRVDVRVLGFGREPQGEVMLNTQWRIVSPSGDGLVSRRTQYRVDPAEGGVYAAVAAMSTALGMLSRDIALALAQASQEGNP